LISQVDDSDLDRLFELAVKNRAIRWFSSEDLDRRVPENRRDEKSRQSSAAPK